MNKFSVVFAVVLVVLIVMTVSRSNAYQSALADHQRSMKAMPGSQSADDQLQVEILVDCMHSPGIAFLWEGPDALIQARQAECARDLIAEGFKDGGSERAEEYRATLFRLGVNVPGQNS